MSEPAGPLLSVRGDARQTVTPDYVILAGTIEVAGDSKPEAVRTAADPDGVLLSFLQSTYAAAADLGGWDRAELECEEGQPGRPRPVD